MADAKGDVSGNAAPQLVLEVLRRPIDFGDRTVQLCERILDRLGKDAVLRLVANYSVGASSTSADLD
jgi:hypothetical protein